MRQHGAFRGRTSRAGVVGVWVVVAFLALAGAASLAIDIGSLVVAVQRCQDVADSAALAAGRLLPDTTAATQVALDTVNANNTEAAGWPVVASNSDVTFYYPNETVAGVSLGSWAHAVAVQVHTHVDYGFGRLLGINGADAQRRAIVLHAPVAGLPLCTMWISQTTPIDTTGETVTNLFMGNQSNNEDYAIPGSFGFLRAPTGCDATWEELLKGYNLSQQDIETSRVKIGDTVGAKPGNNEGPWRQALFTDNDSRYQRGTSGKWANDTYDNFQPDNPRIMLVPLVTHISGTGNGATFKIERFAAFWLEGYEKKNDKIWGRFIRYEVSSGDPDPSLKSESESGVYTTKLIG